jgi:hypothetical protein
MSQKRKKKLREREEHRRRAKGRKRQRCDGLLALLGLEEGFRRLPQHVQDMVWRNQLPAPEVVVEPGAADRDEADLIQGEVRRRLAEATLELSDGRSVPLAEFLAVARPLPRALAFVGAKDVPPAQAPYLLHAQQVTEAFFQANWGRAQEGLAAALYQVCARFSRIDTRLLSVQCEEVRPPHGMQVLHITLGAARPEQVRIDLDEATRPAFRCGGLGRGVEWVTWRSGDLGLPGAGRDLPVYAQHHTLRRLHERLGTAAGPRYFLEHYLWRSLREPRVVDRDGEDFLVEYRVGERRLGYLVARPLPDKVVVRTFLFLTMQGTPEARLLFQKLRLKRPDIEHNHLDRLEYFQNSDLADDPELVELLTKCGCGHLLAQADVEDQSDWITGVASELRRYLGL